MYKIAIFDMDGTLLDTIEDLRASVNHTMVELGFPERDLDTFRSFIGDGLQLLLQRSLPEGHKDDAIVAKATEIYVPYYAAHATDFTVAYDGISEVLSKLQGAGMKLVVLSNKPHKFTTELAEQYFSGLFDSAYGQRADVPKKPDPTAVSMILSEFGFSSDECIYIGDSDVDMKTAANAGVDSIGVTWGYCPKEKIESIGSTVIIHKVTDLSDFIIDKK